MDAKALQDDLRSLGFTPSLAKPETGKEVGRQREASKRRSGIGEDKRHPVTDQLATWWIRSNLLILVALKKGNYLGEAHVRRGQKKALHRRERDSLEGPHEEAEIQQKALRRGKT